MIDWGRVRDLRSEIGADDFAEVVAMFLDEADEVIARITAEVAASYICMRAESRNRLCASCASSQTGLATIPAA